MKEDSSSFLCICAVVSPTGSRPPSRNRNNEMPGDEELGFEAAVAALGILVSFSIPVTSQTAAVSAYSAFCWTLSGMKTTVSEAEHPLLCEGTRRVKGDLALALMITYKDDQSKLKKVRAGTGSSELTVHTYFQLTGVFIF